ncbi:chromosome partitioning protein [Cryobacterium sp. CG_9.6]|uniref:MinD/ParA family ATP-binding protein n=1 Tax=Cryobacterium sp. CG_9.6 TaxID=2760710 RepID=UPI002475DFAD|nr:chromosome partitioning protein [Cryobacterium sp. CG_9.6]MDH6238563.1 putative peptide zinc metalloprotease protein [Cryobacterium sp. CG_9.6]
MIDAVPTFPRIEATVAADATGTVAINGVMQSVVGADEQAVRAEILTRVTATANDLGRPVRLNTRDRLGEQQLAVFPDGHVEALSGLDALAARVTATPTADQPAPKPALNTAQPSENVAVRSEGPAARLTLNDFLQSRPVALVGPAMMGWQGTVRRLTGGLVSVAPGQLELTHRSAIDRVQQSLRGPRTVVVINPKGGAHKTTATLLLAATFGTYRGGYTLAWDNNETRGTLGWRAQPARHSNTAVDLLRDLDRFNDLRSARVGDLDNYVRSQGSTQFDVLASDEDAAASSTINGQAFNELHTTMSRFYRVIVVDTGNNMRASNWEAALDAADQLVIVSTIREDTAASAAWLVDGLYEKGHEEKVRNAVTVLASPSKVADPQLNRRLHSHFASLTRTVLDVPHDPSLVDGGTLSYDALAPATREAWLQVTAAVADGL